MNANAAAEWSARRGERWLANLAGMEATLAPVDERLIAALGLEEPCRIADLGCGGGGTTLAIQRRAPPGSTVHGFDISPVLIEHARHRAVGGAPAFDLADAATGSPPAPFDRLASRFGLMFFDDPPKAFANVLRWLAPRGRCAFAVWGPLAENGWMDSMRDIAGRFVELPRPEPDAPGPFRYAQVASFVALLGRAGFAGVEARTWRGEFAVGGGLPSAGAARFALAAFGEFGMRLAQAGDAVLEAARQALTERFAGAERQGRVMLPACVHLVTASRR